MSSEERVHHVAEVTRDQDGHRMWKCRCGLTGWQEPLEYLALVHEAVHNGTPVPANLTISPLAATHAALTAEHEAIQSRAASFIDSVRQT